MRIALSTSDYFEVTLISRGASNYIYDCNLLVSIFARGSLRTQEVWVDGAEFQSFLKDLQVLDESLKGNATLSSETPGELLINFLSVNSVGKLALRLELGKQIWIGTEIFWSKTIEAYDIDAEKISTICRAFLGEFSALLDEH